MHSLLIDIYLVQLHRGKDEIIGAVCVSAECLSVWICAAGYTCMYTYLSTVCVH